MARARVVRNSKRKYGKQWEVRWSWTERDGARRFDQLAFATKADAEGFATDLNPQLHRGYAPNVGEGRRLFSDFAADWLASLVDVRPRTLDGYRRILDNHVLPAFGDLPLYDIRRSHIEDYVRSLTAKGLTPPTVKHAFTPLKRILSRAVGTDALLRNPAEGVRLPTDRSTGRTKAAPRFLSPEQVEALAHVLDGHPPYGLLIRFIAYTGLRAGEVAGLNVGDVLLGRVQVHRTRDKVRGGWREGTPKSEASTRLVPLPPWLREELGRYLANEHPNGSDAASPLWPGRHRYPDLLTKGTLDWSEPWERDCFYRSAFKPALLRAGLPASVRLHDLRHTYASICASAGIPPYRVAAYLGHAQVTTTLSIYTHLFDADSTDDMDRLARPDSRGARASATLIGMRSI